MGSLSLAVEILGHPGYEHKKALCQAIEDKLSYLVTARPTAVNMRTAANELMSLANDLSKNATYTLSQMKDKYILVALCFWRQIRAI